MEEEHPPTYAETIEREKPVRYYRPGASWDGSPAQDEVHDGKLDEDAYGTIEMIDDAYSLKLREYLPGVRIQTHYRFGTADIVDLPAPQALSLRDWLIQKSPELERMVKEQEQAYRDANTKAGEG